MKLDQPAFSVHPGIIVEHYSGMTVREYAAIHLCVPDSGDDELDVIIRRAQRERLAGKVLAGLYASDDPNDGVDEKDRATYCYKVADAVIAAGEVK